MLEQYKCAHSLASSPAEKAEIAGHIKRVCSRGILADPKNAWFQQELGRVCCMTDAALKAYRTALDLDNSDDTTILTCIALSHGLALQTGRITRHRPLFKAAGASEDQDWMRRDARALMSPMLDQVLSFSS